MKATPKDLVAIDRLIKPNEPPERIYGWLNSQLSLARHYGGMTYQGHSYLIDYKADGQPLVRSDVIKREVKEQNAERKAKKQFASLHDVDKAQGELL